MRHLLYRHTLVKPLAVVVTRWIMENVGRRLTRSLSRRLPGPAGRRVIGWTCLGASVLVQIVCLVLLQQLVDMCIDLAELWTLLAQKHLEITLDETV